MANLSSYWIRSLFLRWANVAPKECVMQEFRANDEGGSYIESAFSVGRFVFYFYQKKSIRANSGATTYEEADALIWLEMIIRDAIKAKGWGYHQSYSPGSYSEYGAVIDHRSHFSYQDSSIALLVAYVLAIEGDREGDQV